MLSENITNKMRDTIREYCRMGKSVEKKFNNESYVFRFYNNRYMDLVTIYQLIDGEYVRICHADHDFHISNEVDEFAKKFLENKGNIS